jgi:peptidoglycan/LPS O-acetylase OafA/YrhL
VRFFGAAYVVFHHSAQIFLPGFFGRMVYGAPKSLMTGLLFSLPASVSFFFLLSGYVLATVYLREGKRVDKGKFFTARFARIYPLYLVTLVLDSPHLLLEKVHRNGIAVGAVKTVGVFLAHVVLLQAWYGQRLNGLDFPNWSLSAEAFFYLCFPALGFLLWKLRGAGLWMTAFCLYVGGQLLVAGVQSYPQIWMSVPLLHLSTFSLGVLVSRWQWLQQGRGEGVPISAGQVYGVLVLVVAGVLVFAFAAPRMPIFNLLFTGLMAPVFAAMIWALSNTTTLVSRLLCADWLVALGNASFALYLIHMPMLHLFEFFHWERRSAAYPVYLVACVGLSLLSFYAFETPVRVWLVNRFHSRPLETVEEASIAQ